MRSAPGFLSALKSGLHLGRRGLYGVLTAALVAVALLELVQVHALQALDNRFGDVLLRWHAKERMPPPDVVLIDIDQPSLKDPQMFELAGAWSWPRVIHAELITALAAQGARAIVLDLILSPPDRFHPENDTAFYKNLPKATVSVAQ